MPLALTIHTYRAQLDAGLARDILTSIKKKNVEHYYNNHAEGLSVATTLQLFVKKY